MALLSHPVHAQQEQEWNLDRCIEYALQHSNEIKSRELDAESGKIAINTAKMSRLPDLNASLGGNTYFGRGPSRDGTYVDNSQLSASFGVSTSIPVFQGMKIMYEIDQAKVNFEAATHRLELAKDNLQLQVTSYYLQVLYCRELVKIAEKKVELSEKECRRNEIKYKEGKSSKSVYIESQAMLAKDKASLVQQRNSLMLALLDLKQAINLPHTETMEVSHEMDNAVIPEMGNLPSLGEIIGISLDNHPSILAADAEVRSSESALKIAKSAYYPSLHFSAGYGNSYYLNMTDRTLNADFATQLKYNGNEYLGLSLSIPIFMRNSVRNNVKQSKIAVQARMVSRSETEKALVKEIEQAYYAASAAYSNMEASLLSLESAELAFQNEQSKMDAGATNIYDYAAAKSNMETAQAELTHAKYDYLLKYRVLEFYISLE